MTQNQPDRLDRIEATLERVSQQLDNQVMVNAELWQSTAELRQSIAQENQNIDDLRQSVSALVETANIHQQGLEILAGEMREQRNEIRDLQEFQRTASAALDRISIVLDYLVRREQ
jgi:archaellum component FlaC